MLNKFENLLETFVLLSMVYLFIYFNSLNIIKVIQVVTLGRGDFGTVKKSLPPPPPSNIQY